MEINIVELLVQTGALGLMALLLYGLWKYGGQFITRLMDNLDRQALNVEGSIRVQGEVAMSLAKLCDHLDQCKDEIKEQGGASAAIMAELSQKLQAHEGRAQRRHEQQMDHADQRHAELIGILKGLHDSP